MWYENSTSLQSLQSLLPGVAILIGIATLLGLAVIAVRYFLGTDDARDKGRTARKHALRVLGFGVGCALLASSAWGAAAFDYFKQTAGMDAIEDAASKPTDRPFSPTNESWTEITAGTIASGGGGGSLHWQVETGQDSGYTAEQALARAYASADSLARGANKGADWGSAFVALGEAHYWSEDEVKGDPAMVARLEELGIGDLSDPLLYEGAEDDGSSDSKIKIANSLRYTAAYWRNLMDRAGSTR